MRVASRRQGKAARRVGAGLSFCLATISFQFTAAFAGVQPDAKITVRVYNYAQVSDGALARAEAEAGRILAAAGVNSVWLDCFEPRGQFQSGANQDCAGPLRGATVAVRILPGSIKGEVFSRDTDLGFAAGSDFASVFYGRITNFVKGADGREWDIAVILGDAIAHELGHLLLGPDAHSPTGIMCGQWDRDYLHLALMGRRLFTPQQSAVLRANVLRRQ